MSFEEQISESDIKEIMIRSITEQSSNIFVFEEAFNQSINELLKKIRAAKDKYAELPQLSEPIKHINEGGSVIKRKDKEIFDKKSACALECSLLNEYVKVLSEMKVVYLSSSIEILMKKLINVVNPEIDTKGFYKWRNMLSYFDNIGIKLSDLDCYGYSEIEALRKVNNNIKHNEITEEDVKNIEEFANNNISYKNIENFYNRIKPKIQEFIKSLGEAIIDKAITKKGTQ